MSREPGQYLLHYRLVERIGEGGMGSVWRALDTTLDRDAAVKILPDGLAGDQQFLARFEREAKLLASLSHPNLAAVFGVHEAESTRFLAMELVPGEDLSQRLKRGPLPLPEAITVMMRIADALEAAHARGVVHRDLKPGNVRLTPDGRVKVLDFGLAKAVSGDAWSDSNTDLPLTATGVVLGTAPYMSPEQARGRAVDARTDLWSFGCVLWECLTGERPFQGETVPDLIASILNEEPDWRKLSERTPPPLVRLLRRCLAKSARERLHHAADARLELEEAVAEPAVLAGVAGGPAWRRLAVPVLAALGIGLGAFALQRSDAPAARERILEGARFTKLTDFPGEELGADISPDGHFVAFFGDQRGPFDAYIGRIGTRDYSGVNGDVAIIGPKEAKAVRRIGFQGGGGGVWLGGSPDEKAKLIPLMGGPARPWLEVYTIQIDWSPDGGRILYSRGADGDPVFVADSNGANAREVPLPTHKGLHQHFPTWSPDGRWIYVVRGPATFGEMDLWRVRPDGTGLERLTEGLRDVAYPVPLDARTVLFVAQEPDGSGPWLWEFDLETRAARRATLGVERYLTVAASADGHRLVATVANPRAGLWVLPILPEGVATEDDVEPHPVQAVRAVAPRIAGDRLLYLGGDGALWRYGDGSSEEVWRPGHRSVLDHSGAISPDGSLIALVVRQGSHAHLYVINADGTEPRSFLDDVQVEGAACWSPEGDWVAVGGQRDGRKGLFKVRVRDGLAKPLLWLEGRNPVWSPDGSRIVFQGVHVGPLSFVHAVTPEGQQLDDPPIRVHARGERIRFLPDGTGLVYLTGQDPYYDFYLLRFESGEIRRLTSLASSATTVSFDITQDGKTIVFDRERDNSDIVLIERDARK